MRNYSTDQMLAEVWLARVLRERGIPNPNLGITDLSTRKENFRTVIKRHNLAEEIAGWKKGYPEKFADVFNRIYNEQLEVTDGQAEPETNEDAGG